MTDPDRFPTPPDIEPSELLDQVMRGERFIGLPPGTLIWSAFIPCMCPVGVSLGYLISVLIAPFLGIHEWYAMMVLGLLIVFIAGVGQALVARGRSQFHRGLRIYVRVLWYLFAILVPAAFLSRREAHYEIVLVGGAFLLACTAIINSRSYLVVTSFMSLKRKYRLAAQKHAKEVLARGKPR